jgi:hypothetical protein
MIVIVIGYNNSDWVGDMNDRKSTIGFFFFLHGRDNIHMEFKEETYNYIINL